MMTQIKDKSFSTFETHIIWEEYVFVDTWYDNLSSQLLAKFEAIKAEYGLDYIDAADEEANIFEEETPEQLELKNIFQTAFDKLSDAYSQSLTFSINSLSRITPMHKYDYKPAHSHSDIDAFGIFYIDVEEGVGGNLVLHDPRFHNQISFTSPKTHVITPVRGTLIAAPAYVWHEVSRYLGDSTRLAVVCNCIVDFESKKRL